MVFFLSFFISLFLSSFLSSFLRLFHLSHNKGTAQAHKFLAPIVFINIEKEEMLVVHSKKQWETIQCHPQVRFSVLLLLSSISQHSCSFSSISHHSCSSFYNFSPFLFFFLQFFTHFSGDKWKDSLRIVEVPFGCS